MFLTSCKIVLIVFRRQIFNIKAVLNLKNLRKIRKITVSKRLAVLLYFVPIKIKIDSEKRFDKLSDREDLFCEKSTFLCVCFGHCFSLIYMLFFKVCERQFNTLVFQTQGAVMIEC